jgi:mevalonate pyrophosphate decarboxylase
MCPLCLSAAAIAAGGVSSVGFAALVFALVRTRKEQTDDDSSDRDA